MKKIFIISIGYLFLSGTVKDISITYKKSGEPVVKATSNYIVEKNNNTIIVRAL